MLLGIVSDIHEDIASLRNALDIISSYSVDGVICLGDLVGYSETYYHFPDSRNANAVVTTISEACSECVAGNHDLFAIRNLPSCRGYFPYPEDWYSLPLDERKARGKDQVYLYDDGELPITIDVDNLNFLRSLPEMVIKDFGDHRVAFTHYAFPDCTGSSTLEVKHPDQLVRHFDRLRTLDCIYGFSGHDHRAGTTLFTPSSYNAHPFGEIALPISPAWIQVPAIVSQDSFANGLSIYDSSNRTVRSIPNLIVGAS